MITNKFSLMLAAAGSILCSGISRADTTYQVTGPVLEVTDAKIVVSKGKEKWEVARTADTKVTGDLKVGDKVTVTYTMTAATIENKSAKTEKPAAKTEKPTAPATDKAKTKGGKAAPKAP